MKDKKVNKEELIDLKVEIVDLMSMDDIFKSNTQPNNERNIEIGDVLDGTILNVTKSQMIVDLDGMASGVITGEDLADSANTIKTAQAGDCVKAMIIGMENKDGQYRMSLKRASREGTWNSFLEAFKTDKVVAVTIVSANKGGLLVEEDGIRGFIPVSQLSPENYPRVNGADSARILARLEGLVGTKMKTKILNIDNAEQRLIFSEREAYTEDRMKVIEELEIGKTVKGEISGVVNFGVFINYKGIEGLVHISEIAWGHVSSPMNYFKQGDIVDVLVIGIEGEKVSFSIKRLMDDPWIKATENVKVGEIVKGPVVRMTPFGVFIKVKDDVEGLIHVSELGVEHVNDPLEVVKLGDDLEAKIISVDKEEHRLGLSIKALKEPADSDKKEEKKESKDSDKKED